MSPDDFIAELVAKNNTSANVSHVSAHEVNDEVKAPAELELDKRFSRVYRVSSKVREIIDTSSSHRNTGHRDSFVRKLDR